MIDCSLKETDALYGVPRKTVSLILALCVIPFTFVFYAVLDGVSRSNSLFYRMQQSGFVHIASALLFMFIWFAAISLATRQRKTLKVIVCLAISVSGTLLWTAYARYNELYRSDEYVIVGFVVVAVLWALSTVIAFRPTRKKRLKRMQSDSLVSTTESLIFCPGCGQDMTSATELICPQCGENYMLSDILEKNLTLVLSEVNIEEGEEK